MQRQSSDMLMQSDLKQLNISISNLIERETKDKNNRIELRRKIQ
jgi:hypothetical protein